MKAIVQLQLALVILLASASLLRAQGGEPAESAQAAYVKVTQERAAKIVAAMNIADTNRASRVRDLIAQQYQDLSRIHDSCDAQIVEAGKQSSDDKAATEAAVQAIRDEAKARLDRLHQVFLDKLSAELSAAQVDQVKDGLTYGVAPLTYGVYLKMYPALTDEQKQQVLAWLHEAREIAMDAGDSKAKHAVFGKYKGRINNYLVKEGYDLKAGERNLKASNPPPAGTTTK